MNVLRNLARGDTRGYNLKTKADLTGYTVRFCIKANTTDPDAVALANVEAVLGAPDTDGKIFTARAEVTAGPAWPLGQVYYGWRLKGPAGKKQSVDQGVLEIEIAIPMEM